jgi:uncharacterized protein (TIGR00255 family)
MLKSMTGFGRYELSNEERKVVVEMKSVNHRYCDISIKMPKKLGFYEATIRSLLKKYIQRGKVDVFISYEDYTENKVCVKYNSNIAREYVDKLREMGDEFHLNNDINVSSLSRYPEVLTLEEQTVDETELWNVLEEVIIKACEQFAQSRAREGEHLKNDLISKLDGMLSLVDAVESRSPQIITEYRNKITAKVQELLGDTKLDESILATEITLFADKICVDEETVRLKSHINHMKTSLDEENGIGRKLDFIAQEMNREANTILSKANDLEVTNIAIDLKTEIEKVREQIQNIE